MSRSRTGLCAAAVDRLVPPLAPRALSLAFAVLVLLAAVAWLGRPDLSVPGSPPRKKVSDLLDAVVVVDSRRTVPGYERDLSLIHI